ncbi:hypothetical protein TNCV_2147331 [Trichonephila clavipes]|uniref:Uncharacterized protein n=1 Tax=Trichonephila clavipes TaxID=2585209 RepID=A0A8X6SZ43_TRICX|nr:hypothetical protein TNCV_2147331 [Trichonephila clavipes]
MYTESSAPNRQRYQMGRDQQGRPKSKRSKKELGGERREDIRREDARAAVLSKSEDFINEVLDDASSGQILNEEECLERIWRKKGEYK